MTTIELRARMNEMLDSQQFFALRNWLSRFPVYFWNGKDYTKSEAAAMYDRNGSCINSYIKCEDGFVKHPF